MKEATLRDFFLGATPADRLVAEARDAVETVGGRSRRVYIEDLPAGEELIITAPMLVRLCDGFLAGEIPAPALEIIAFAVIASDHMRWYEDDHLVGRVLYDWAVPEINFELTPGNVRMFREWLTGKSRPPSEPEMTADSLSDMGFLTRTQKVNGRPSDAGGIRPLPGDR